MENLVTYQAWICLGTNLGDRLSNLETARERIKGSCGKIIAESGIYESRSWGYESENEFYNQCIALNTRLDPLSLLQDLQLIEKEFGREKKNSGYEDRSLDLDILFYDDRIIEHSDLVIPHPHIAERMFVLRPLSEISPRKIHPVSGLTVEEMMTRCKDPVKVKRISS